MEAPRNGDGEGCIEREVCVGLGAWRLGGHVYQLHGVNRWDSSYIRVGFK